MADISVEQRLEALRKVVCSGCKEGLRWREDVLSHVLDQRTSEGRTFGFGYCAARVIEEGPVVMRGD